MKDIRFEMRLDAETAARLDELRRKEPDLPPRAEMIRRLIIGASEPALPSVSEMIEGPPARKRRKA